MMQTAIIVIYTLALLLIFLYSLIELRLLLNYLNSKKSKKNVPQFNLSLPEETPFVTIQLPIYNELYVVERLLDNIAQLDYPTDKLEIQVLDDSTDESLEATRIQILRLQQEGVDIQHITRKDRRGFKAGALKEGLNLAKGEFIAIFDSDFLPAKNWLKQTIPYFKDAKIGVVQTRWGHLNRDFSLLTQIQAFALDYHFIVEQGGRHFGDHFINFNGTAGVWRKSCILDAGNWKGDTLTEDLDLSYRAQLKNWKFKYLEEVETPAELPIAISASRTQQFRWNKGAAENFQKLYKQLLKDPNVPLKTKIHCFFHLLNSSLFLLTLILALLSVPVLYIQATNPKFGWYMELITVFGLSTLIFFICYWVTYKRIHGGGIKNFIAFIGMFFTFFSITMGFSVHNSIAVLEGHFGKKSDFIRTPKFNLNTIKEGWKGNVYLKEQLSINSVLEVLLCCYFGLAILAGIYYGAYGMLPFHLMLFAGFGFVSYKSLFAEV